MSVGTPVAGTISRVVGGSTTPGLPAGTPTGGLMVLVDWLMQLSTTNTPQPNTPAGWTSKLSNRQATSTDGRYSIYYRRFQSGDTAPTVSITGGSAQGGHVSQIFYIPGAPTSGDPFDALGTAYNSTGTVANIGPILGVTVQSGGMVLVVALHEDASSTSPTTSATLTGDGLTWAELVDDTFATGDDMWEGLQYALVPSGLTVASKTIALSAAGGAAGSAFASGIMLSIPPGAPSQSIAPTTIAAPAAPGSPTITSGFVLAPTTIPAPAAPSAPTVTPGPVTVAPTAIAAPPAPGSPSITLFVRPTAIPAPPPPDAPTITQAPRPPLRVDFWALDDDKSILCPLPQPVSWDLSLIPGEVGAVSLEYPVDGLNYDILNQRINRNRDLFIQIRTDGTALGALGAILQSRDGDEVAESGTVTFTGSFNTQRLEDAGIAYNAADPAGRGETIFSASNAGQIFGFLLTAAHTAGFITDLHWTFTNTHDSRGTPWPHDATVSTNFPPGKNLLQVAQQLRDWGMAEFEVTTDFEVRLYVPETVGVDHTTSDPPLILRRGRDLLEAPRRTDVRGAITDLTVIGAGGVHVDLHDATARALRGRKIQGFVSDGNLTDISSATVFGNAELARTSTGVDELTHTLTFDQNRATPLREINPSDWVYSDTGAGIAGGRERIAQLTVSQRAGEDTYSGGVVLRDLISDREVSLQRQIDRMQAGATIVGTSEPAADDGKVPAAPTGLVVSSEEAFQIPGESLTFAQVAAQWTAVTTNVDGSAATDIALYRVRWAYLGADQIGGLPTSQPDGAPLSWREPQGSPTQNLSISWADAEGGRSIGVEVAAIDNAGNQGDWSARVDITTQVDDTAPDQPSTPVLDVWFRTIDAHYDGLGFAGEPMAEDTDRIEVWFSQTAGFSVPDPDAPAPTTEFDPALIAPQHTADLSPVASTWNQPNIPVGIGWYVGFRAIDRTGNPSPLSVVAGPVTAEQLVTIDIGPNAIGHEQIIDLEVVRAKIADLAVNTAKVEEISAGLITTGTLISTVTLSGTIQTATSGLRWVGDAAGIRFFNASGVKTIDLQGSAGGILVTGTVQSGLTGERWVMFPDGTLRIYPASGTNYSQFSNEGSDVVWRGPLDVNGRSGRVNTNQLGVGLNFSNETELTNLRAEIVILDRLIGYTSPNHKMRLNGKQASNDGSGQRFWDFLETNSSGVDQSASVLRFRTISGVPAMIAPGQNAGFKCEDDTVAIVDNTGLAFANLTALTVSQGSSRLVKWGERDIEWTNDNDEAFGTAHLVQSVRAKEWGYLSELRPRPDKPGIVVRKPVLDEHGEQRLDEHGHPEYQYEDADWTYAQHEAPRHYGPMAEDLEALVPGLVRVRGGHKLTDLRDLVGILWDLGGGLADRLDAVEALLGPKKPTVVDGEVVDTTSPETT